MLTMICALVGSLCGGTVWMSDSPLFPATKGYVQAQTQDIKSRVIELQMQQNTARRDVFRTEQFNRQQELQKDPANFAVKQRLDAVNDELDSIKTDRDKLTSERGK